MYPQRKSQFDGVTHIECTSALYSIIALIDAAVMIERVIAALN